MANDSSWSPSEEEYSPLGTAEKHYLKKLLEKTQKKKKTKQTTDKKKAVESKGHHDSQKETCDPPSTTEDPRLRLLRKHHLKKLGLTDDVIDANKRELSLKRQRKVEAGCNRRFTTEDLKNIIRSKDWLKNQSQNW